MISFFGTVLNKLLDAPFALSGAVTVAIFLIFFLSRAWLISVVELPENLSLVEVLYSLLVPFRF